MPTEPLLDHAYADVACEPGLWVEEDRLRSRINVDYLCFRARRRRGESPLRVPPLCASRERSEWKPLLAEALSLARAVLARRARVYRVRRGAADPDATAAPLRCIFSLTGKQNTLCFGWSGAPHAEAAVYKLCRSREQFEQEVGTREALARHFRVPDYSADAATLTFRERFVTGELLADVAGDRQVAAVRALIEAYTALAASGAVERPCGAVPYARLLRQAPLADVLRRHGPLLQRHGGETVAPAAQHPRVLCHNDLSGSNIIVADEGTPVLIDFERAAPNLFFADVLWLVGDLAVRAQPHCLKELLRGGFDAPLRSLWRAAKREYDPGLLPAHLLSAICSKTVMDVEALGPECWSARTFGPRLAMVAEIA